MTRQLSAVILLAACSNGGDAVITVDPAVTYQTMRGWEATGFITSPCHPDIDRLRDAVLDAAVEDVGIDRIQVQIRSGTENTTSYWQQWFDSGCPGESDSAYAVYRANRYATVNDNADPSVIDPDGFHFAELDWTMEHIVLPLKQRLEAKGKQLFLNVGYIALLQQITSGSYHHHDPDEYAEFVLATHLHLRDRYGLVPDTWEVVTQPDNGADFDGALMGRAMAAAADRLITHGFTPNFAAPSTSMAAAPAYLRQIAGVPGVLSYVREVSYYGSGEIARQRAAVADTAARYGLPLHMFGPRFGYGTHEVLHEALKSGRISSWQSRTLGGLFDLEARTDSTASLEPQPDVRFSRQYFAFIRRGAVRVEARSTSDAIDPLAFTGADGFVVVVKADRAGAFTVIGLPPARYGITYTTDAERDVDLPAVQVAADGRLGTAIPDRGVITVWMQPQQPN